MKMISNDLRSSCRALLLQSYDKGGSETEVEWKYPDDWLPLPKAEANECILLIRPSETRNRIAIMLYIFDSSDLTQSEDFRVDIDWGDGLSDTITAEALGQQSAAECEHIYGSGFAGQYLLVKIKTMYYYKPGSDGTTTRITASVMGLKNTGAAGYIYNVLAVSVGTGLETGDMTSAAKSFNAIYARFEMNDIDDLSAGTYYSAWSGRPYSGYYRYMLGVFTGNYTKRIDFTGSPKIWGCGYNNPALQDIKVIKGTDTITKIHDNAKYTFGSSYALDKLTFANVSEISSDTWNYLNSVREIYLPKCVKIGAGSICNNQLLQKITVAKGCEIDPTALQNNYQYVEITEV